MRTANKGWHGRNSRSEFSVQAIRKDRDVTGFVLTRVADIYSLYMSILETNNIKHPKELNQKECIWQELANQKSKKKKK